MFTSDPLIKQRTPKYSQSLLKAALKEALKMILLYRSMDVV
jgi:hypothetical protein